MILTGSHANGKYHEFSDVDLLICGSAFEGVRILDRFDCVSPFFTGIPIEPICMTPMEIAEAFHDGNLTILDALNEGVVLFDNGKIWPQLVEQFKFCKSQGVLSRIDSEIGIIWKLGK